MEFPFDTTLSVQWTPSVIREAKEFFIVRWGFEGSTRIHVEFNLRPDDNALDISHYTLSPFGSFTHIERDASNLMPFISILLRALLSRPLVLRRTLYS